MYAWQVTFCKSLSGRSGETLFVTYQSLFTAISSMAAVMFSSEACCQGGSQVIGQPEPVYWSSDRCQQLVTCTVIVTCHLQVVCRLLVRHLRNFICEVSSMTSSHLMSGQHNSRFCQKSSCHEASAKEECQMMLFTFSFVLSSLCHRS